ncbi:MAG: VOC family protein [Candidatus Aminicenantes bacterium]|nr:VOC family protein [Candidatus Aminicenantes bacterium]
MSGIVFFKTQKLKELQSFYVEQVGCTLWLDQGGCIILRHGSFLFGFCQREDSETCGMLTFFYKKKEEVDRMYKKFKAIADAAPKENKKYDIYHFFARDPEGRAIEFQYFINPIEWNF